MYKDGILVVNDSEASTLPSTNMVALIRANNAIGSRGGGNIMHIYT